MRFVSIAVLTACAVLMMPILATINPFTNVPLPQIQLPNASKSIPTQYPESATNPNYWGDFFYAAKVALTYFASVFTSMTTLLNWLGLSPVMLAGVMGVAGILFLLFFVYIVSGRDVETL